MDQPKPVHIIIIFITILNKISQEINILKLVIEVKSETFVCQGLNGETKSEPSIFGTETQTDWKVVETFIDKTG